MIGLAQTLHDPNGIVSKLVFEDAVAIAETVAYKYEDRGVVCFSVQSGCPIGCSFCGTGKRFIRSLSATEMIIQIHEALKIVGQKERIQIMSMSMGEPMCNWVQTRDVAEYVLAYLHYNFYVSTVGLERKDVLTDFIEMGCAYNGFGLQFSLHHWNDTKRKAMLGGYPQLASVDNLSHYGNMFTKETGRPCYWNYICTGEETDNDADMVALITRGMHATCSVLCNTKAKIAGDVSVARRFAQMLTERDVNTSVFDPAGQDTIGGGCGQLHYVQQKLNSSKQV